MGHRKELLGPAREIFGAGINRLAMKDAVEMEVAHPTANVAAIGDVDEDRQSTPFEGGKLVTELAVHRAICNGEQKRK